MLDTKPLRVVATRLDNAVCGASECQVSGPGKLWFNVTSGFIGCGYEEANHSFQHFKSRQFPDPLVVRIDSIATEGEPEIYSYVEKGFVRVPNLKDYLRKIGINSFNRDRPICRIDVDAMKANMMRSTYKPFDVITIHGFEQQDVAGSAFIGLRNPHTMCYAHSSIQALASICDSFKLQFYQTDISNLCIMASLVSNPATDLEIQTTKLVTSLMSQQFAGMSIPLGIHTTMFKDSLISLGHPSFAPLIPSCAHAFIQYMMEMLPTFGQSFEFVLQEQRWQGDNLSAVNHSIVSSLSMDVLDVFLAIRDDVNMLEYDGSECPDVPIDTWLNWRFCWKYAQAEDENGNISVKSRCQMVTFPDVLMLHLGQSDKDLPNGKPNLRKLKTFVVANEIIDLSRFKSTIPVVPNDMPKSRFMILEDQSPETVAALSKLRILQPTINDEDAIVSLRRWKNDVEKASDWFQNNRDLIYTARLARATARKNQTPPPPDHTNCRYKLYGVIEHRGDRIDDGHFVVYLRKPTINTSTPRPPSSPSSSDDPDWYLVNDELATKLIRKLLSRSTDSPTIENVPPVQFGYVYLYKKIVSS